MLIWLLIYHSCYRCSFVCIALSSVVYSVFFSREFAGEVAGESRDVILLSWLCTSYKRSRLMSVGSYVLRAQGGL